MKAFGRVYDPDEDRVHIAPPPCMDQVTLCGQTDWIGNKAKPDHAPDGPVDCWACLQIVAYVQSRKFDALKRR